MLPSLLRILLLSSSSSFAIACSSCVEGLSSTGLVNWSRAAILALARGLLSFPLEVGPLPLLDLAVAFDDAASSLHLCPNRRPRSRCSILHFYMPPLTEPGQLWDNCKADADHITLSLVVANMHLMLLVAPFWFSTLYICLFAPRLVLHGLFFRCTWQITCPFG